MTLAPKPNLRRRLLRVAVVSAAGAAILGTGATAAQATVTGGCRGAGTIEGVRYDAAALDPDDPITIPEAADVAYEGSVPLAPGPERAYSGHIDLELPLGAGVEVASWGGSSDKVGRTGVHHYDVPAVVPRGVTVQASGIHRQEGLSQPCQGRFAITLDGGPLDSPLPTGLALGGTVLTGALLAGAGRPKGGKL